MQGDKKEKIATYDSPMYSLLGIKNALADSEKQKVNK